MVKNGEVFFKREVIAGRCELRTQRPQYDGPLVFLLEAGHAFGRSFAARPPLLHDDRQAKSTKSLASTFARIHVERNVHFNAIEAAVLDLFERPSSAGRSSKPHAEQKSRIFIEDSPFSIQERGCSRRMAARCV